VTKLDYESKKKNRPAKPLISQGELEAYRREASQLADRQKRGVPTKNKTTRLSGPPRTYLKEEIEEFAKGRNDHTLPNIKTCRET